MSVPEWIMKEAEAQNQHVEVCGQPVPACPCRCERSLLLMWYARILQEQVAGLHRTIDTMSLAVLGNRHRSVDG